MPVTIPVDEPIEATAASALLHEPPVIPLVSVTAEPAHNAEAPVIVPALAELATVTMMVAAAVPQELVT